MNHIRKDYQRIQDPAGLIPEDEPVFLIRGQDKAAPETLEAWAEFNSKHGGDWHLSQAARAHAAKMRKWQEEHGSKCADVPQEPAEKID